MIQFGNKQPFDFCVSSGALAFDGGGWWWERPLRWIGVINPSDFVVVAKTVTNTPRKGNLRMYSPWTCVRNLPEKATTNAVGLTNPGIDVWIKKHLPFAIRKNYRIVPSIKPENPAEAGRMIRLLDEFSFNYVEVNLSCPNVQHVPDDIPQIMETLHNSHHSIVLKLSLDQVCSSFIEAVNPYVDGYHAINTIPWDVIYSNQVSPIQKYKHGLKGGVSGPPIKSYALSAISTLKTLTQKPIIGGGGIFTPQDICLFQKAGASAYSFGTCFLHTPWRPNQIVREFRNTF